MIEVHLVKGYRSQGQIYFEARCGVPDVRTHWWTINPALVSCEKCLETMFARATGSGTSITVSR